MDIVVKIKQYLLVTFVLSNVQLIAMNLKNSDVLFEQQCELAQKQINELMNVCNIRSAQEYVESEKERELFQNIQQYLESDRNVANEEYSQMGGVSPLEYDCFGELVRYQVKFYENLLNGHNEKRLILQMRMTDTGIALSKIQMFREILKQKMEQYTLQQMSKKHQEANDKQLLLQQLANVDEKRKQTNRKRKLEIAANSGESSLIVKKRRINRDNSVDIMLKQGVGAFGTITSQPYIGPLDHLPPCTITRNFSNTPNRIVGIAPKKVVRKK